VKKILVVVHQPTSDPGLVGQILEANGCILDKCCPMLAQPLPTSLDDHDGVVVFGGPMSANDETLTFIRDELAWIPSVLDAGKPYLGVCLGAQLLARVLGAKVAPHSDGEREIGYRPIQLTAAGTEAFGQSAAQLTHVYHWHKEGFELPQGSTLLATGKSFPHQAFCYGDRTYAIQFHPEITEEMIHAWVGRAAPEDFQCIGAQAPDDQLQHHWQHGASVEQWLTGFLEKWLY
jgi:GMP synthase (glutamine-hydrolysing)